MYEDKTFGVVDNSCSNEQMVSSMVQNDMISSYSDIASNEGIGSKLFDNKAYDLIISALQNDEKAMRVHNWSTIDRATFLMYFSSQTSLEKHLQKHELSLCLQTIANRL